MSGTNEAKAAAGAVAARVGGADDDIRRLIRNTRHAELGCRVEGLIDVGGGLGGGLKVRNVVVCGAPRLRSLGRDLRVREMEWNGWSE